MALFMGSVIYKSHCHTDLSKGRLSVFGWIPIKDLNSIHDFQEHLVHC